MGVLLVETGTSVLRLYYNTKLTVAVVKSPLRLVLPILLQNISTYSVQYMPILKTV